MNFFKRTVLLILLINISNSLAQYLSSNKLSGVGLPYFQAEIFRTFSANDGNRIVRLYFQILNDDLTFIKQKNEYVADIQFDIYVNNKEKEYVFNRSITKRIIAKDFNNTNSRLIKNTFYTNISLSPNSYEAIITALDKNSNKQINRKLVFELESLITQDFLISDILFFQDYEVDSLGNITTFEPNLTSNFGGNYKYFYFNFSTFVKDLGDTLYIEYVIRNSTGTIAQINRYPLISNQKYNQHFVRINRQQLDQSRYELEVSGCYKNKTLRSKRSFSFYWTEIPDAPKDLTSALEQMRYIPEADSIKWALKQDYKEQLAYFQRFWKRMDPNPDTEKNELIEEYYQRVNIANQLFSTPNMDGWLTDRGRIYIKFGSPDDIERHPFELNTKPYQIWRYYSLRKTFLFIDKSGFGDYFLDLNYLDVEYTH